MVMNGKFRSAVSMLAVFCIVFACFAAVSPEEAWAASKPGKVKGFKAKVSGTSVKLSWKKAAGKVSRYVIYRDGKKIASVSGKKLKYTDKNRKYGKTYRYRVRAYRKDTRKYGKWSAAKQVYIKPSGDVPGEPPVGNIDIDIHCAQTARDVLEQSGDLGYLVNLIKNVLQQQAVKQIIERFPFLQEAGMMGYLGLELPLYIYYEKGDMDGIPEHEELEKGKVEIVTAIEAADDDYRFKYLLAVDASLFCKVGEDGYSELDRSEESMELLKNRLTGAMLQAIMYDYIRAGMIGATYLRKIAKNEEGEYLDPNWADEYNMTVFPKWFTEGSIASVETVFRTEREQFRVLRSGGDQNLLGNYVENRYDFDLEYNVLTYESERSCRAAGHLAVLYLSELMATKDAREAGIDVDEPFDAKRLREGLGEILHSLNQGNKLDEVISEISPEEPGTGKKLYDSTEEFEQYFIKGKKNEAGEYTGDQNSINFVNTLLGYLESGEQTENGGTTIIYGGSILTDLEDTLSPLDETAYGTSYITEQYMISDNNTACYSTAPDYIAMASGGRSLNRAIG